MSLEHIPRFVWRPIAWLIWAFVLLVLVLTVMSIRAKWVEIDFFNLAIKVENIDQQISIAQQKISTTMDVINSVTKQLNQFQDAIQSATTKPINMNQPQPVASMPKENTYDVSRPVVQQLQMQETQLEEINDELRHVQDNLKSSVLRKKMQ